MGLVVGLGDSVWIQSLDKSSYCPIKSNVFWPLGRFAAMLARRSATDKDGSICNAYNSSPARFLIETGNLSPSRGPTCAVNAGNAQLPNSMKLSVQVCNAS